MSENTKIRKAVQSDAPIIERIVKTAFEEYSKHLPSSPEALTETLEDIKCDIRAKLVFVAIYKGNTVGTVRLAPNNSTIYLSRFAVSPEARHLGLGKKLLEYADLVAKENDCNEIYLHTAKEAKHLIELYTSSGYEITEITTDRGYKRAKLVKKV